MDMPHYQEKLNRAWSIVSGQRIAISALSLAFVVVTWKLIERTENQRTVIMPPNSVAYNKPFWIEGDKASDEYLENVSINIEDNIFNLSPADAHLKIQNILVYAKSKNYGKILTWAKGEAKRVVEAGTSNVFRHTGTRKFKNKTATSTGILYVYAGDRLIDTIPLTLRFSYEINNGTFYLNGLEILKGGAS